MPMGNKYHLRLILPRYPISYILNTIITNIETDGAYEVFSDEIFIKIKITQQSALKL